MDRCAGAAARLPGSGRKDLAIQALAGSEKVSNLAAQHGVRRKFVYRQTHKAVAALDDAFLSATPDHEVLFEVAVTKAWLRQVIVGLTLICRSSYRGVVEFLRDLLGLPVSIGTVLQVLQSATRQASIINRQQDLSGIRVGLHDEIFQGATPVLAGVDAVSMYCYLLAAEQRRDADAVEGFFAKLTKRRLKRGVFHSLVALQAAIKRFVAEANANPKPFCWTKDLDKIIAAVRRGHQALDSLH